MNQIFVIYRTCPFCNINPSGLFFSFQNKTISLLLFQRHWHCCMWHSGYYGPLGFPGQFICVFFFFFFLDQKYYTLFLKLFLEKQLLFFMEQHCIYIFFLYIFFLLLSFCCCFSSFFSYSQFLFTIFLILRFLLFGCINRVVFFF